MCYNKETRYCSKSNNSGAKDCCPYVNLLVEFVQIGTTCFVGAIEFIRRAVACCRRFLFYDFKAAGDNPPPYGFTPPNPPSDSAYFQ